MIPIVLPATHATLTRKMPRGLVDKQDDDARHAKRITPPGTAEKLSKTIYKTRGFVVSFMAHTGLGTRENYGKNENREKQVMAVIIRATMNENGSPLTTNKKLTVLYGQMEARKLQKNRCDNVVGTSRER